MKSPRTTKPGAGNKYYIRVVSGGYSNCVKGKPTDANCDVLANCVGFADGFFNEEHEFGYEKYHFICNAENFIERAIAAGLSVYNDPMPGGIMVWQKGDTLNGSDGAGHVCGVTWVNDLYNPTQIKTSESGYGSKAFWTATRNKGNGNWGAGAGYKYRGCIAPVGYVKPVAPSPEPSAPVTPVPQPVVDCKFKVGDKVVINGKIYKTASGGASGNVSNKVTTITRVVPGKPYPYNTTGDLGWMAEDSISMYVEPTPQPVPAPQPEPVKFAVGDRVKPIKKVDYNGRKLVQYDDFYYITELKGDRAVLSAKRNGKYIVWAAMNTNNITKA